MAEELGTMRNGIAYTFFSIKANQLILVTDSRFFTDCAPLFAWEYFCRIVIYCHVILHRDLYFYSRLSYASVNCIVHWERL